MANPGYLDLFIPQGATYNTSVSLADVNGAPINLTHYVITSMIKKSYITSNVAANFNISVSNTVGGVVELSLSRHVTANLTPKRYVYDVVLLDTTSDSANRILEGTIYLTPGTTVVP